MDFRLDFRLSLINTGEKECQRWSTNDGEGEGRGLSNARVWPFAWKSEQQVQARDKRMKEALVVKILSVFGLAGLGRGNMLVNSLLPTSTVLFLARPALGIVLSNNNQRGGSFSNRVKSNLPSLNVSFWIWHWRNEPWTL